MGHLDALHDWGSIRELAVSIAQVFGFSGCLEHGASRPDGILRELMDLSRLASLGWAAAVGLAPGLIRTHRWPRAGLSGV